MSYRKSDIDTHNDGGIGGPYYPAVKVKSYHWPWASTIQERFACSEATAERASEYAWEAHAMVFWEDAEREAEEVFPDSLKVYSAGRSGGWLIVTGLPPIESWDAIMVSKWGRFEAWVLELVEWSCKDEEVLDTIEANEWALDADAITAMMVAV